MKAGDMESLARAEELFRKALQLEPQRVSVLSNLAETLKMQVLRTLDQCINGALALVTLTVCEQMTHRPHSGAMPRPSRITRLRFVRGRTPMHTTTWVWPCSRREACQPWRRLPTTTLVLWRCAPRTIGLIVFFAHHHAIAPVSCHRSLTLATLRLSTMQPACTLTGRCSTRRFPCFGDWQGCGLGTPK